MKRKMFAVAATIVFGILFAAPAKAEVVITLEPPIRVAGIVVSKTLTDTSFTLVTADTTYEVVSERAMVGLVRAYRSTLNTTRLALHPRKDGKHVLFGIIRNFDKVRVEGVSQDRRYIIISELCFYTVDIKPFRGLGYTVNPDSVKVGQDEHIPNVLIISQKHYGEMTKILGDKMTDFYGYVAEVARLEEVLDTQ